MSISNDPDYSQPLSVLSHDERRRFQVIVSFGLLLVPLLRFCAPCAGKRLSAYLLNQAAFIGDERAVVRLLNMGADPNVPGPWSTLTPLMIAAVEGHLSMPRFFIVQARM